jgi:hypothetical protein
MSVVPHPISDGVPHALPSLPMNEPSDSLEPGDFARPRQFSSSVLTISMEPGRAVPVWAEGRRWGWGPDLTRWFPVQEDAAEIFRRSTLVHLVSAFSVTSRCGPGLRASYVFADFRRSPSTVICQNRYHVAGSGWSSCRVHLNPGAKTVHIFRYKKDHHVLSNINLNIFLKNMVSCQ